VIEFSICEKQKKIVLNAGSKTWWRLVLRVSSYIYQPSNLWSRLKSSKPFKHDLALQIYISLKTTLQNTTPN